MFGLFRADQWESGKTTKRKKALATRRANKLESDIATLALCRKLKPYFKELDAIEQEYISGKMTEQEEELALERIYKIENKMRIASNRAGWYLS